MLHIILAPQLRLEYTKAVFEWIYGLDREKGEHYNLYFLAPPDIVVETPPYTTSHSEKVEHVKKDLAPRYRSIRDLWHFMTHEHLLYSAKHVVQQMRVRL